MVRRRTPPEPPSIEVRQFTRPEINRGIGKLRRRIEEVNALDPRQTRYDDAKIDTVEANIRETIREVFGPRAYSGRVDHRFRSKPIGDSGMSITSERSDAGCGLLG